jgi:oxygen-independent coproporphyrinogen-3 oxidase
VEYNSALADEYICALIKHARHFKAKEIHSVYIGGGTPSVLTLKQIQDLFIALHEVFDLSKMQEFTVELNPESASKEKLHLLRELGVNRLSIGLQSIEDKYLHFLGRMHNFETFYDIYNDAKKENFNSINIDLIYGLPNQTLKDWQQTLKEILFFDSEHISLYPLSIEDGTFFYKNCIVVINDDIQRDMYDISVEFMENNGYDHYEISNWSKKNKESLHNINYWRNLEYIGLGAGAAGYIKKKRYKNIENVVEYIRLINKGFNVIIESEYIHDELHKIETIMLGLRLLNEGVYVSCFDDIRCKAILWDCLKEKILIKKNNKIKLAKEYVFVSNQVISKFIK